MDRRAHRRVNRRVRPLIRTLLAGALLLGACRAAPAPIPPPRSPLPLSAAATDALLDDLEERTFRFFWDLAHPASGLVPDRWPTPSFSSVAAVGFGLTAYPIGAERGWVTNCRPGSAKWPWWA